MMFDSTLQVIRSLLYINIFIESVMLGQLYWYGNKIRKPKPSNTIRWLRLFLNSISLFFIYMAILPIIKMIDTEAYLSAVNFLTFLAIPIIYALHKFRMYSINENGKKLKKR